MGARFLVRTKNLSWRHHYEVASLKRLAEDKNEFATHYEALYGGSGNWDRKTDSTVRFTAEAVTPACAWAETKRRDVATFCPGSPPCVGAPLSTDPRLVLLAWALALAVTDLCPLLVGIRSAASAFGMLFCVSLRLRLAYGLSVEPGR